MKVSLKQKNVHFEFGALLPGEPFCIPGGSNIFIKIEPCLSVRANENVNAINLEHGRTYCFSYQSPVVRLQQTAPIEFEQV